MKKRMKTAALMTGILIGIFVASFQVQAEEYVSAGSILGYISEPTKYYTKEGANLYFALSKDGVSLDPMQYLP